VGGKAKGGPDELSGRLDGLSAQIAKLIAAMDEDDDIRVIVIRGAHGLYSSGGDIAGFRSRYEIPSSANAAL
jgi:enoyl-CoA hydratase/carnithine racemase